MGFVIMVAVGGALIWLAWALVSHIDHEPTTTGWRWRAQQLLRGLIGLCIAAIPVAGLAANHYDIWTWLPASALLVTIGAAVFTEWWMQPGRDARRLCASFVVNVVFGVFIAASFDLLATALKEEENVDWNWLAIAAVLFIGRQLWTATASTAPRYRKSLWRVVDANGSPLSDAYSSQTAARARMQTLGPESGQQFIAQIIPVTKSPPPSLRQRWEHVSARARALFD